MALRSSVFRDKNTTFAEPATHTSNAVNLPESNSWYRDVVTGQTYSAKFPELRDETFAEIHLYTPCGTQRAALVQFNLSPELYIKLDEEVHAVLSKRKEDTLKWRLCNAKKRRSND